MNTVESAPRIALLADTYYEVNGAARTCREWEAFARERELPFFCVRWGKRPALSAHGPVWTMDLVRSRWAVPIDPDLYFDLRFAHLCKLIEPELERFRPDFIHITSPGDLGILGAVLAARLKTRLGLSWHTNLHEFAGRRIDQALSFVPAGPRAAAVRKTEDFVLDKVCWFFGRGDLLFAPNPELIALLAARTGKPVFPMARGVDTTLFTPARRARGDCDLVLGFVGRLMPEKNLRLLPRVLAELRAAGIREVRFQITGHGSEQEWLARHLPQAELTGVLTGEPLARAYANMDIFLFPSRTDTFGNVVQEALASGVSAVVTDSGGPRFIVRDGITGFVASSDDEFCARVLTIARDEKLRRKMASAARREMLEKSWSRVFE
ncbi:MAG TPA: glycosyltransferase [Bryobacteraceae bacterium]|jgi:glycosyltransferase involved in cell wall biosynthesis|nr:glycosyltransferase [Bryobacteraceae bacterium]